jgi:D-inositol-3-phosphate glycosyltransferase
MRIAQISYHTNPLDPPGHQHSGGLNVYIEELSRQLSALGHQVDIITRRTGEGPIVTVIAENLRLIQVEAGPAEPLEKELAIPYIPVFSEELVRFAKADSQSNDSSYDVVHSHYWQGAQAGMILAKALKVSHVVMFHTLGEAKNRARMSEEEPEKRIEMERLQANKADVIVVASAHEKVLLQRFYGVDGRKVSVIPCGVDLEHFAPLDTQDCRRQLGLDPDKSVFLWVGRLEELKGVDILIGAAAEIEEKDFSILIVGGGADADRLRPKLIEEAKALGLEDIVFFEDAVPRERLPIYYGAADAVVVPSYYESFGLVAVEAMASGRPVIASRVGGLVSIVTDGVDGYLIPWRCPEPFAEKIEVLMRNSELRKNFGKAARRSVESFSWEHIGKRVEELYIECYRN